MTRSSEETSSPETSGPVARRSQAALSWRTLLLYASPIIGISAQLFFIQFFFLKFATDVLLLAPATIGVVFALGRVWDAVSDPIVGTWSDRTRTRWGRRRPWMLLAIPVLGLSFALVWIPPRDLGSTALVAWIAVALFMFYTSFTAYAVPHTSLGAELTSDHHDRSRIFGVRHAFLMLGIMFAFGGMQLVQNAEQPRATAASIVLFAIPLCSLILLMPPLFVRERPEYQGRGAQSSWRAMADVLRNRHARLLLAAHFIEIAGNSVLGIVGPYFIVYIVKRPDLIGPLPALFFVASVASIPFWVRASRRFGKRNVWRVAMLGLGLSFGSAAFVDAGEIALLGAILVSAGVAAGCGGAIGYSILADVIDYDEYRSGERKEGAYAAAHGFATKAANASVILGSGFALQLSGFEPNVEQAPAARLAITGLFAGGPLVLFLLGSLLLTRLRLDEAEHQRVQAELQRRGSSGA